MMSIEALADIDPEILTADGFDEAFLGVTEGMGVCRAVYDSNKCIEILEKRDGTTREEAREYFSFNVTGAYVGEYTPVFVDLECGHGIEDGPD